MRVIERVNGKRAGDLIDFVLRSAKYNMKIIFAGRFVYFLIAAVAFFLFVTLISFFSSEGNEDAAMVYRTLLLPGILLIFYPTVFGIQHDVDARMIEILFGIPNYRYKVWLVRIVLIYALVFAMLVVLAGLSAVMIVSIPVFYMVYHLMFPVFFLGSLAFMFSTLVRSGNGTGVIMVVIGMAFWISAAWIHGSKWFLFLNPFDVPRDVSEAIWSDVVMKNRIYLSIGTVLALLYGLLNLQKRERFI
jgi:hypothetical protein